MSAWVDAVSCGSACHLDVGGRELQPMRASFAGSDAARRAAEPLPNAGPTLQPDELAPITPIENPRRRARSRWGWPLWSIAAKLILVLSAPRRPCGAHRWALCSPWVASSSRAPTARSARWRRPQSCGCGNIHLGQQPSRRSPRRPDQVGKTIQNLAPAGQQRSLRQWPGVAPCDSDPDAVPRHRPAVAMLAPQAA